MQNTSNKPIYLQIADRIKDDILSGRYPSEQRIPSVRELAADCQVNVNTVVRTYEELERERLIFNKRGLGFFVVDGAAMRVAALRRQAFFDGGEMEEIFGRLKSFGLDADELTRLYSAYLDAQ